MTMTVVPQAFGASVLDRDRATEEDQVPRSERRFHVVRGETQTEGAVPASQVRSAKPLPNALPSELPNFNEAFRLHAPHLRRIARRILGADDEVDDVVQDVFIRAHQRLPELRNAAAMRSWLGTITVRVARRRMRSSWFSRVWRGGDDTICVDLQDTGATPEQYSMVASFNRYLQRLPPDQRLAWVLCEVEEKTLPEAAKISACSLSTVTRRLQAAKSRIKKAMRE